MTQQSQLEDALAAAYDTDGPMLLEFKVEREINVYPMVAQDASLSEGNWGREALLGATQV